MIPGKDTAPVNDVKPGGRNMSVPKVYKSQDTTTKSVIGDVDVTAAASYQLRGSGLLLL